MTSLSRGIRLPRWAILVTSVLRMPRPFSLLLQRDLRSTDAWPDKRGFWDTSHAGGSRACAIREPATDRGDFSDVV